MLTIDEFFKQEQKHRKAGKWFIHFGLVKYNDQEVHVAYKACGFYVQVLRIGQDEAINYASGHTINTVKGLHTHIKASIELALQSA